MTDFAFFFLLKNIKLKNFLIIIILIYIYIMTLLPPKGIFGSLDKKSHVRGT
jgi:hypothetical protein